MTNCVLSEKKQHIPEAEIFIHVNLFLMRYGKIVMLLLYSLGLGIPFVLSAVLIDKLKSTFNFIKKNYKIINTASGALLVLIGILMATGTLGKMLNFLS